MLTQFRTRYPHGSLISELITIDRGQYIVKVTLQVEGVVLSTGLAADDRVEAAEDRARERALIALALDSTANLPISAVTTVNHADKVTNKSSHQQATTPRQLSTERETDRVQPLPVNTPMTSTSSLGEKRDSGVNNHLLESSNFSPEIDKTDFNAPSHDLSLSTAPPSAELIESKPVLPSLDAPFSDDGVSSTEKTSPEQLENSLPEVPSTQTLETIEFDFNEIIDKTDIEIKRLGWTKEQGRDFLLQTYGKRSRLHLTNEELMDFLHYLESQPN